MHLRYYVSTAYLDCMIRQAPSIVQVFEQKVVHRQLVNAAKNGALPGFLDKLAAEDLADRLALISRPFRKICIVGYGASIVHRRAKLFLGKDCTVHIFDGIHHTKLLTADNAANEHTYDGIVILPGLEWENDLPGVLVQLRKALVPDGVMLAAMLGGETLHELRSSWLSVETDIYGGASPRVAPFCDVRNVGNLLQRAGFTLPVVDTDRINARYQNCISLMRELKTLGLSNALAERRRCLTLPRLLGAVCSYYDSTFADRDGRVRATFQLIYLSGWSPHDSQPKPLRPGSAKMRLADALNPAGRKSIRDQ